MLFNLAKSWLRYTKVSTLAYVGTFYALAMSWPFTLLNCFLAAYCEGQNRPVLLSLLVAL